MTSAPRAYKAGQTARHAPKLQRIGMHRQHRTGADDDSGAQEKHRREDMPDRRHAVMTGRRRVPRITVPPQHGSERHADRDQNMPGADFASDAPERRTPAISEPHRKAPPGVVPAGEDVVSCAVFTALRFRGQARIAAPHSWS